MVAFFGKLPSHGDFVGRRLPPEVKDCFDRWLQAGLVRSREDLGDGWLPVWLSSPIWRFVVAEGVCGEQAWAGVMMPSHDRVGRCFPLLLMAGIAGTPSLRDCLTVHQGWFERLEELALSSLDEAFTLTALDLGLVGMDDGPRGTAPDAPGQAETGELPAVAVLEDGRLPLLAEAPMPGASAWWTDGSAQVQACLAVCRGMPAAAEFAALLDGEWAMRNCRLDKTGE
ncbi:hypothetical protein SRABI118_04230 [Massilia sp. Bi118]|uniref:type VI secretion system-associated protein TagF n=1 Tax=Massilia sp. Bi118 TaxID=2822346 RepID=UPI001D5B0D4C|nr:type VI secretion system-associated protein TagF [Massilia sp. Bi118]CAH0296100.1 hypothetical protein SRABI118_04230 [Massilia sp. Bi118]